MNPIGLLTARFAGALAVALSLLPALAAGTVAQGGEEPAAMNGQPVRQQTVSIHCALGDAAAATDMQGYWKVDATGLGFPCLIVVPLGPGKMLYSIAPRPGAWYVSPMTNAALMEAMPDDLLEKPDRERAEALPGLWRRLNQTLPSIRERLAAARIPVGDNDLFRIDGTQLVSPAAAGRDSGATSPLSPVLRGIVLQTVRLKMPSHPEALHAGAQSFPPAPPERLENPPDDTCPPGQVWLQSASIAWQDALPANGQSLPVNGYPDLFRAIGNRHGGDGVSAFKLPDARHRAPRGFTHLVCTGRRNGSLVLQ